MSFGYGKYGIRTLAAAMTAISCLALTGCGKPDAPAELAKSAAPPAPIAPPPAKSQKAEPARVDPAVAADATLVAAVKSAIADNSRLKSFAIDVRASNGAVELFGTVDAKPSREKAEKIAAGVAGVKTVKNHLILLSGS